MLIDCFVHNKMNGIVLTSDNHSNQFVQTFSDLYRNNILTDVTLICDDKVKLSAHKLVLCAGSSFFRDHFISNPHDRPQMYLKGVKQQFLLPLLQFMYHGETTITEDILNNILKLAKDLEISGLQDELDTVIDKVEDTEVRSLALFQSNQISNSLRKSIENHTSQSEEYLCRECNFRGLCHESLQKHEKYAHQSSFVQSNINRTEDNTAHNNCSQCNFQGVSPEAVEKHMHIVHSLEGVKEIDIVNSIEDVKAINSFSEPVTWKMEWNGVKLFGPTEKITSSRVWKHGGFVKDENGRLDKSKVICCHCGKELNYKGSPTNFRSHLQTHHSVEFHV